MGSPLFDPAEHEALTDEPWDAAAARAFVARIVREIDASYDGTATWPVHPENSYDETPSRTHGLYDGAAGTMWTLVRLAARYGIALAHDYGVEIARCEAAYRADPSETETLVPSYLLGSVGITLARYAIAGDREALDRIAVDMRANIGNLAREALWGSPGTAFAALLLRERDGDSRLDDVLRDTLDELWFTWIADGEDAGLLWEQDLYGKRRYIIGAGHGAFGNLVPFVRARDLLTDSQRAQLRERIAAMLATYAMRDGEATNYWSFGCPLSGTRMQWCHGSPGVITSLAGYPAHDERIEHALVAAGEGVWRAGPLRKGPTLCHGTAGNGFAFLRLAERTGNARWYDRAERFAMHAMRQVVAWRAEFEMPASALWTGDVGVAVYLDAVLRRDPAILGLDTM